MIQSRSRIINKLALVLLSIVVLELVLIGDQVQPVKAIKKKIYLKKLKKLLPLLMLVKPKKKLILLPIPIPMFKNPGHHPYPNQNVPNQHYAGSRPMVIDGSAPMSFMMMGEPGVQPGLIGFSMDGSGPISMLPMSMSSTSNSMEPIAGASMTYVGSGQSSAPPLPIQVNASNAQQMAMVMPSMTMTIQSESGGNSAIELSTNLSPMSSNSSLIGELRKRPQVATITKWHPQHQQKHHHHQQQQQQQGDHFDEPLEQSAGEQYYSSPWMSRSPISSPAKLFRDNLFKGEQQSQHQIPQISQQPVPMTGRQHTGRLQQQPQHQARMIFANHQWRPSLPSSQAARHQSQQEQPIQQHVNQALEYEELIPIGPPQMFPVYQTASGGLQMSPPPPPLPRPAQANLEHEETGRATNGDLNSEVQTVGGTGEPATELHDGSSIGGQSETQVRSPQRHGQQKQQQQQQQSVGQKVSGRLSSPATKGKQQQPRQNVPIKGSY